jgi:hypothetical protein
MTDPRHKGRTGGDRLRVVVLGYIVRGPLGGLAWHHLQYVMGLARLGHDVYFAEDSDDYEGCYDPSRGVMDADPAYGLAFIDRVFRRLGLGERWAYHDAHAGRRHGPAACFLEELGRTADLLLNVSGMNPLREWSRKVPCRALIDTDPVFTQVRHLTDAPARAAAARHTAFFTFAENFGRPGCTVPADGFAWQPTRQPVVLDAWPVTPGPEAGRFTTVMQWDSYAAREHGGRHYGMKSESFRPYLDVPRSAPGRFELALGSVGAPRELLRAHGWQVSDPLVVTRDPWTYQEYLRNSRAEFGVAKHGYVVTRSGWFSERSAAYLASGRPVVVQDTGFSAWLPTGSGVLAFREPEEALAAIDSVNCDYETHCRAARALAEEYFDAGTVLPRLLGQSLERPPADLT